VRDILRQVARGLRRKRRGRSIAEFARSAEDAPRADDAFSQLFFEYDGERLIHKWAHYLSIYSRLFAPFRNSAPRFLEIGVSQGGSLEMWRSFFGPNATIFGIDVDSECAKFDDHIASVRIGSQADPAFLHSVVAEMGGLDIVLDDGSHVASLQAASLKTLFPLLSYGGLYIVEDAHTAYWSAFEGGYRRRGTIVETGKSIIDDLHAWYHDRGYRHPEIEVGSIQFFDSIVAIEKQRRSRPFHVKVGAG
jgi:cephalosporin hydroxylase